MNKCIILILMIFCHIVDDFYLQGILASLKQREWWKEHYPERRYRYDYITALLIHSFSWAFIISLPIAIACEWQPHYTFYIAFVLNLVLHAIVDDLKANKLKINLTIDQSIHLTQILITWGVSLAVGTT